MSRNPWTATSLLTGNWRGATSVLVSNGRQHLVVDTGMPHEEHLLLEALAQHGLKPPDIQFIINTHFHIDHVLNNTVFTNSEIYASQESYDWCCSLYSALGSEQWESLLLNYYPEMGAYGHTLDRMHQMRRFTLRWWNLNRLGKRRQFRWIEQHALPDGFDALITSGHVPGHLSVVIPDGAHPALIAGDAFLSRSDDERVMTMIPHNRAQARRDRNQILSHTGRIFPGHDVDFDASATGAASEGPPPTAGHSKGEEVF